MKVKGIWIFLAILVILVVYVVSSYNGLVKAEEDVKVKFSNIGTVLQERLDLIPNLVSSVKGYMTHEKEVLELVANARTQMLSGNTDAIGEADNAVAGLAVQLLSLTENYPELNADEHVTRLMDELASLENQAKNARQWYNEQAATFNKKVRTFPSVLIARMFGFSEFNYFEATEGANVPPVVEF